MKTLFIIIPAYNEAENIRTCIEDWYPIVAAHNQDEESRLVVVDDGSTDETLSILREIAEDHPLLVPLTKENGGHGSAVLFGYRHAIEHGADYIFQTESDGQTDPMEFEEFWWALEDADAVLGDRRHRQDGRGRKLVEAVLRRILRAVFRVRVPDANAPFRLMRASLLKKYLPLMPENYELPNVMLTTFFAYYQEKVKFLPISFRPRQGGENSIDPKKIAAIGRRALRSFLEIRKKMPPR